MRTFETVRPGSGSMSIPAPGSVPRVFVKRLCSTVQPSHATIESPCRRLLSALMLRSTHVLTREQLESALYSWGGEVESNAIEVHIHYLRKKLGGNVIRKDMPAGSRVHAVRSDHFHVLLDVRCVRHVPTSGTG